MLFCISSVKNKENHISLIFIISRKNTFYFWFCMLYLGAVQSTLREVQPYFSITWNHFQVVIFVTESLISNVEVLVICSLYLECPSVCSNPLCPYSIPIILVHLSLRAKPTWFSRPHLQAIVKMFCAVPAL